MDANTLSLLYRFKFGDHTCVFYRDDSELLSIVGPYLLQGLRQHERCFVVQRKSFLSRMRAYLETNGISLERAELDNQFACYTIEETYLAGASFDPNAMCDRLLEQVELTRTYGFKAMRTAGDLSWIPDVATYKKVLEYEGKIAPLYAEAPMLSMCQYPVLTLAPEILESITSHHNIRVRELPRQSKRYGFAICSGDYCVELVANGHGEVLYTLQRLGSDQVLSAGSEPTFDEALHAARRTLMLAVSA